MKYLIIGAGGTGSAIGMALLKAGKDVTFIGRGADLEALQENGLQIQTPNETLSFCPVQACTMESYQGTPDVIFVCVKGYSLDEATAFIKTVADKNTVVIPILNIYGTGEVMQKDLPGILVTDGCIYVAAHVSAPGHVVLSGNILRVVYGVRNPEEYRPVLETIRDDLQTGGAIVVLSDDIRRDAMMKYSYISAQNACGVYYDVPAGGIQNPGECRDCFAGLNAEIKILAEAMGIQLTEDPVKKNLAIIDTLVPEMMTSMQRDLKAGKQTEIDGLVFHVERLAKEYGVSLPLYEKICSELRERRVTDGKACS